MRLMIPSVTPAPVTNRCGHLRTEDRQSIHTPGRLAEYPPAFASVTVDKAVCKETWEIRW